MRFALLLLWLTILAPAAHAADWLTWRRVGEATLTWDRSPSITRSCVRPMAGMTARSRIGR